MQKAILNTVLLFAIVGLISCQSKPTSGVRSGVVLEKENKSAQVHVVENKLGGFKNFAEQKVALLMFQDLPDSYLIKAQGKLNPPDVSIKNLKAMSADRAEVLNQAVVTYCDSCKNFDSVIPLDVLNEDFVLHLLNKISLNQEITIEDFDKISTNVKSKDFLWVWLITDDFEFKRSVEKDFVIAKTENEMKIKSLVFDIKKHKVILNANVSYEDVDGYKYNLQQGAIAEAHKKDVTHPSWDQVYPYPPEADSLQLLKSATYGLFEKISGLE